MTKQTGTIITIVVAVLTLCCSTICCASGIFTLVDEGRTLEVEPYVGIPAICLGLLVWVLPLLLWLFLVRGKENSVEENFIE